jgi:hypothetical protein
MMIQMRTSQQPPLKLLEQRFSTLIRSDSIESIMIHAYLVRFRLEAFLSATQLSSALQMGSGQIGLVGNVGTERQIAAFFNCRTS